MPFDAQLLGQTTEEEIQHIGNRRLMAFSAGVEDWNSNFYKTDSRVIIGHPVFPVSLEWLLVSKVRNLESSYSLSEAESERVVHLSHDMHLYAPVTSGQTLTSKAKVIAYEQRSSGVLEHLCIDTCCSDSGELVSRTYQSTLGRGVELMGEAGQVEPIPELLTWPESHEPIKVWDRELSPGAAHIYSECSDIWNPIHTDLKVALDAGLPGLIMHGSALLAMAVSNIVNTNLAGESHRVVRVSGRFTAMVMVPGAIKVSLKHIDENVFFFDVLNERGKVAIRDGVVVVTA